MISVYYQIRFKIINPSIMDPDEENNIHGGIGEYINICGEDILIKVICGCCGSVLEPEDIEVLDKYDSWMDLTETIIGN